MTPLSVVPAAIAQPSSHEIVLTGHWTVLGIGAADRRLAALTLASAAPVVVDGAGIERLDTAGTWLLQRFVQRLRNDGHVVELRGWSAQFSRLFDLVASHRQALPPPPLHQHVFSTLERVGHAAADIGEQMLALLAFIGESAVAFRGSLSKPARIRWRPILYNIRSAGFDALPIIGLLSFLLGVIIAYQSANKLAQYGANIFVADLVGLSVLREFAPLMTAIIVAGRSGSAYAAQIGTMSVTEEIDAMRTLGIAPFDLLVLPKIIALMIALPLLTLFADVLGVFGGMLMARAQLGVGFADFLDRFVKAVTVPSYLIGIGKAPVFAAIIAVVGCFQGFRTSGNANSVGIQTTRSVVQAIFLVIVADAFFSVLFSFLRL